MSILIKDMEMPKEFDPDVYIELACGIDGKRYARLYNFHQGGLTEWCEAVPVPPHGDLIDRDKLREKEFVHDGDAYAVVMARDIRNAPTIIPAEEGELQKLKQAISGFYERHKAEEEPNVPDP